MLKYKTHLKFFSRDLRNNMTNAEILLWSRLRNKQVLNLRFSRQKPLLHHIVDFYCHQAKLVIECDGSQHFEGEHMDSDKDRDDNLSQQGVLVLRFDNSQIITQLDSVMGVIWDAAARRM